MFIVHLFTIAEIWKQSKHSSMDEWIKSIYSTHYIYTMLCELMCHLDLNKAGRKKRNCYIYIFAFVVQLLGCVQIFVALWSVAHQIPLFMDFPRQEYWSGLPFPPPGDLSHPRTKSTSLTSPAVAGGFFTTSTTCEAPRRRLVTRNKERKTWLFSSY